MGLLDGGLGFCLLSPISVVFEFDTINTIESFECADLNVVIELE